MAITYNKVDIRGVAAEPIFEEILFENNTIAKNLVTFEDDVKAETIFTEATATAVLQAYTCGVPTAQGSLNLFDTAVTPDKVMFYQEFCPDTLRFSRFKRDMKAGAMNTMSGEFERLLIGGLYAKQISLAYENAFWNGIKATTKTAIAALTPGAAQNQVGAAEQTLAAGLTAGLTDGIISKMLYNASNAAQVAGLGGRIKVVGTAITSANIKSEYSKIFAALPAQVLAGTEQPIIYAPYSDRSIIIEANNVTSDFNRPFQVNDSATDFMFQGVKIEFVPIPTNVRIAALKAHLIWATDLVSDFNAMEIDKIANNRDDMFIKNVATLTAHVANQRFNVLYVA